MPKKPKEKHTRNLGGRRDFNKSPAKVRQRNRAAGHESFETKVARSASKKYNSLTLPKRPIDQLIEARESRAREADQLRRKKGNAGANGPNSLLRVKPGTKKKKPKNKRPPTPSNL